MKHTNVARLGSSSSITIIPAANRQRWSRPYGTARSATPSSARHTPPTAERGRRGVGAGGEGAGRMGYCVGAAGGTGGGVSHGC